MAQNMLTFPEVAKALRKGEPCELKDGGSLSLKVTGKNAGKWLYRGRKKGDRTLIDLICGYAPDTGLSEARAKRDEYKALLKQGINPNQQKRMEKEEARRKEQAEQRTFAFVAEQYFSTRGDMVPETLQGEQGRVKNHMGSLANLPIAEIRRLQHLKPVIDALVKRGNIDKAKRVGELIGRIFAYAVDCGYIELSPAERLTRLVPRQAPENRKHHAAMTRLEDAAKLFRLIWEYTAQKKNNLIVCSALQLYCYLPLRSGNLLAAKWQDVDTEKDIWHFPRTKNGRAYELPISKQVKGILLSLQEYKDESGYILPSPNYKPGKHVSVQCVRAALRRSGLTKEEQSLHGFRSVFQSIAKELGCPHVLTERALFHVAGGSVQQAYDKARYEAPLKALAQWWCDTVDAMREGRPVPELPQELQGKFME